MKNLQSGDSESFGQIKITMIMIMIKIIMIVKAIVLKMDNHDHDINKNNGGDDKKATLADIPNLTSTLFA